MRFTLLLLLALLSTCAGFLSRAAIHKSRCSTSLQMGFADILKKALANDPSLPPAKNPGLSREPEYVSVEFLPSKKVIKAIKGESLSQVAKSAGVDIKYSCKKGECRTCEVMFDGIKVKACTSFIPSSTKQTKFQVVVP